MIVHTIDDVTNLTYCFEYLESSASPYLVLDTETDSLIERQAKLYGIGLCVEDHEAFYIPIRRKDGSEVWESKTLTGIKLWLNRMASSKKLVGHNIIYDVLVLLHNFDLDLCDRIFCDTILLKHSIDEERPFGLKEVAVKYLGEWANKAQTALYENIKANGGKTTKEQTDMYKADTEVLAEYCGWDCLLTLKLFHFFQPKLIEQGLEQLFYQDEIMPLYREITIPMKKHGFPVNVEYFKKLNLQIKKDIDQLETQVVRNVFSEVSEYCKKRLDKEYPVSKRGLFPKFVALQEKLILPIKNDKPTLGRAELKKTRTNHWWYSWMLEDEPFPEHLRHKYQIAYFKENNPDRNYAFNLRSNDDLKYLFFDQLKLEPLSKTETGEPQIDDEFLESIKSKFDWVPALIDFKKLNKLQGTYIEGILERQLDGVIYASFLQFGTISGRYSCTNPNLQNLPRVKDDDAGLSELVLKYVNSIKKGFIAPENHQILNSDYSQLEPTCFAEMSGDEKLKEVFRKNLDLYSSVAIHTFGMEGISADKKSPQFLKKLHPEKRQQAKIFTLAVPYGAGEGQIAGSMDISKVEAKKVIASYLSAYPGLKAYMEQCERDAKTKGYVKTLFGRIRHLPLCKEVYDQYKDDLLDYNTAKNLGLLDLRYKYKNALNNAKNFPIQGLAAHIVNRAMIATVRKFAEDKIKAWPVGQVHDELTFITINEDALRAKAILKDRMENTVLLSIPLSSEPLLALTWADAK